ncbi:molybdenum cofactor sulfurase-like [Glandiceps talaboti]
MAGRKEDSSGIEFDWQHYGYKGTIEHIRRTEFARLDGVTYLDHAGTTLYAQSQLNAYHKDLSENIYGNPHSHSASSRLTTDTIEQIRYRVLQYFNVTPETHSVIFTSGCTGSLKLLAESFDWSSRHGDASCLCYLEDNHTSVIGMREIAAEKGAKIICQTLEEFATSLQSEQHNSPRQPTYQDVPNCLFAYAAQCNFSGRKNPLEWTKLVKNRHFKPNGCHGNWFVVLDAASLVTTSPLDLRSCKADFVTISFYKMFGFPTGLGALIVRNESSDMLTKSYFGGGTVLVSISRERFHEPRTVLHDKFEDGTVAFLDIIALRHGFDVLTRLTGGMAAISDHVFTIASYVFQKMASYHHGNGAPVAKLYHDTDFTDKSTQGPIINFNIIKPNGDYVGYAEVDKLASLHDIHLRTGCFCNTGACQRFLGMSTDELKENFEAGHICGDDFDLIDGHPTGSVRISFGYMSTYQDATRFLDLIEECFIVKDCQNVPCPVPSENNEISNMEIIRKTLVALETEDSGGNEEEQASGNFPRGKSMESCELEVEKVTSENMENKEYFPTQELLLQENMMNSDKNTTIKVTNICLYPIKSCAAMEVTEWQCGPRGLLYDRSWMIVNENGVCLSQKRELKMCLIKPKVDLNSRQLILQAKGMDPLRIPIFIHAAESEEAREFSACQSKVCGDRVHGMDCGSLAAEWVSSILQRSCRLIQQDMEHNRISKLKSMADGRHSLSLANESQFLLINRISVCDLKQRIKEKYAAMDTDGDHRFCLDTDSDVENLIGRFRGNFVIDGGIPYDEDRWIKVQIGEMTYRSGGLCSRCQMVCINQENGERSKEPLTTLATFRNRKVPFGIHLFTCQEDSSTTWIRVGDPVIPLETRTSDD